MKNIVSNYLSGSYTNAFELFTNIPEDKHYFVYNGITHNSYNEVKN
jgi:hypothetical protein